LFSHILPLSHSQAFSPYLLNRLAQQPSSCLNCAESA
jgi:hypothetical protein